MIAQAANPEYDDEDDLDFTFKDELEAQRVAELEENDPALKDTL